jgi:hypothetical protein
VFVISLDHSGPVVGFHPLILHVCKIEPSLRQDEQACLLGIRARAGRKLTASVAYFRYSSCFTMSAVHGARANPAMRCDRSRFRACPCDCSRIGMSSEMHGPLRVFGPQEDDPMSRPLRSERVRRPGRDGSARRRCRSGLCHPSHAGATVRRGRHWTGWTVEEVTQGQRIVWQIPFEAVEPNGG